MEAHKAESKEEKKGKNKDTKASPDPTGKFKPPTPEENNRRVIDGKHMWYNMRSKRWYPDRKHAPAAATAVANPTPTDSVGGPSTSIQPGPSAAASTVSTNSTISSAERSAAVHTARQAYASAYATAMNQLAQVGL